MGLKGPFSTLLTYFYLNLTCNVSPSVVISFYMTFSLSLIFSQAGFAALPLKLVYVTTFFYDWLTTLNVAYWHR